MASMSSKCTYVEISPPKWKNDKDEEKDEIEVLVLAPFNRTPKIFFHDIKVNSSAQRKIVVKNPSNSAITVELTQLPSLERCLEVNFTQAKLLSGEEILLEITWSPKTAGSWKETLPIRTSSKFKTDVTVVCSSIAPQVPKKRKKVASSKNSPRPTVNAKKLSSKPRPLPGRATASGSMVKRQFRLPDKRGVSSPCRRQTFLVRAENKENSPPTSHQSTVTPKTDLNLTSRFTDFVLSPAVPLSQPRNLHLSVLDGFVMSPVVGLPPQLETEDCVDGDATRNILGPSQCESNKISPSIRRTTFAVPSDPSKSGSCFRLGAAPDATSAFTVVVHPPKEDCAELFYDSLDETNPQIPGHPDPGDLINRYLFGSEAPVVATENDKDLFFSSTLTFDLPSPSEDNRRCSTIIKKSPKGASNTHLTVCKDLFPNVQPLDICDHIAVSPQRSDRFSSETYTKCSLSSDSYLHDRDTHVKDRLSSGTYVKDQPSISSAGSSEDLSDLPPLHCSDHGEHAERPAHVITQLDSIDEEDLVAVPAKLKGVTYTIGNSSCAVSSTGNSNKAHRNNNVCLEPSPSKKGSSSPKPNRRLLKVPSALMMPLSPVKKKGIQEALAARTPVAALKKIGQPKVQKIANSGKSTRKNICTPQANLTLSKQCYRSSLKLAKRQLQESEILHNTDDLFSSVTNVDIFAVDINVDPFLSNALYNDEAWVVRQEKDLLKWLNALLTPPEELQSCTNPPSIDVADLWQKTCRQKEVGPALTREELSSDVYGKQHRLAALRKAAVVLLRSSRVSEVLQKVSISVDKKLISVRDDRELHVDVGLQHIVLELLLCYNPLWLRIGLEAVYGRTIALRSNSDIVGLVTFVRHNLLTDDYIVATYSHPTVPHLKLPGFQDAMKKFTLKKFLFVVYFLDRAKSERLIGHDPCLFLRAAKYKDSRDIVIAFARDLLAGVGDISRHLALLGCQLHVKQTYLDEFEYGVQDLLDLRDGVRLCRVMELIMGTSGLMSELRVPAISKLQKIHNVDVALTALRNAGYTICGNITAKDIVIGHREKTLSLLWQMIYKFQGPLFVNAATTIQKWWRRLSLPRQIDLLIRRRKLKRRDTAATTIQATWRGICARRRVCLLREERAKLDLIRERATLVIQKYWRRHVAQRMFNSARRAATKIAWWYRGAVLTKRFRAQFLLQRASATKIQATFRGFVFRKRFTQLRRTAAALRIQTWFRRRRLASRLEALVQLTHDWLAMKRKTRTACIVIQRRFRAQLSMRRETVQYRALRMYVVKVQRRFRAQLVMKVVRASFLRTRNAAVTIQQRWRARQAMRRQREEYLAVRSAVIAMQNRVRSRLARKSFLTLRWAATVVQRRYRARIEMKHDRVDFLIKRMAVLKLQVWVKDLLKRKRERRLYVTIPQAALAAQRRFRSRIAHMMNHRCAAVTIQRHYRSRILMKRQRAAYLALKKATCLLQDKYRATLLARETRGRFVALRSAVICVQQRFCAQRLMRVERATFLNQRGAALVLQKRWRAFVAMKTERKRLLQLRESSIVIQRRWRAQKAMRQLRHEFLEKRAATIAVQRRWRANRMKRAASVLQRRWRARNAMRRLRTSVALRSAVICVQQRFRAQRLMRIERTAFLRNRSAALVLQQRWRAFVAMKTERKRMLQLRESSIVIQRRWRAQKAMRQLRHEFLEKRAATIAVQRRWRAILVAKQLRRLNLRLNAAVGVIQKAWRKRHANRIECQRKHSAALKIQALWRGYLVRKSHSDVLRENRRVDLKNANSSNQISILECIRDHIMSMTCQDSVGSVLDHINCLEVISEYSPLFCELMVEMNVVSIVLNRLTFTNRSVPHLDLATRGTRLLLILCKHDNTLSAVWKDGNSLFLFLHLMKKWISTSDLVLLNCLTIFWHFAHTPSWAEMMLAESTLKATLEFCALRCKSKKTVSAAPASLPSCKPNWATLNRNARPEAFKDALFGIRALSAKLKLAISV